MTALVLLVVLVLVAVAYRAAWRWTGQAERSAPYGRAADAGAVWRRREQERARRRERARQRRLPPPPAEVVPPAGLSPLVPSPRTVRVEAARGIRELEVWLADQASA